MRNHLWLRVLAGVLVTLVGWSYVREDASVRAAAVQTTKPVVQWFSPRLVPLGVTTFSVNGTGFMNGAIVRVGDVRLPTTFVSSTELRATSNVTVSSSANLTVLNPNGVLSAPRLVEFGAGIVVTLSPSTATVAPGAQKQFTANVTGTTNTQVWWYVNGGTVNGTISNGLYKAPAVAPASPVTILAVSAANSERQGKATVTVSGAPQPTPTPSPSPNPSPSPSPSPTPAPITVAITPTTAALNPNATLQFVATVNGTTNKAVTWQVNNVTGGSATAGLINTTGLYTAPASAPASAIMVSATSQADATKKATATVTINYVPPALDQQTVAVGRFLEQSTFGPTPALMTQVKQSGIQSFLDAQFNTPESVFPNGNATTMPELTDQYFLHYQTGPDQLRQRMIHTLSEIIVISRNKNYYPDMLVPWLQILSKNAFGNYRSLLKEITLDASMGNYLDMVNSVRPGVAGAANENYPRELMQLFSIGLYKLNQDGSLQLDANNQPIPTYTQNDVRQIALALTGWTYNRAGTPPTYPNQNYYPGPMYPLPGYHDTSSKTFLGKTLPANQPMDKDVDDVIDAVFNHPNAGPFLAVRLIRGFTTSNPSPAYIARIAAVFNDNGFGVRGDLKAMIRAILLDPEARNDAPGADYGKLRSPLLHTIAVLRALGGTVSPQQISYLYDSMGDGLLHAPSVFGHYSPMYRIPKQTPPLFGPEFQVHGAGELVNRGNFFWGYMNYYQTGIWDLSWLFNQGANHNACIDAVNNLLLYGRMSSGMRQKLLDALQTSATAGADAKMRALTVLYLTVMSSEYMVMH